MEKKHPEIYKNKIESLKSKIQSQFYFSSKDKNEEKKNVAGVDKLTIIKKINDIFARPDYVYQADVIIMYKNGENKRKKIVGFLDNKLITLDNEKIHIDDILDIK